MPEFQLAATEAFDPKDALVLLAFPAVGSAPAIAADYLRRQLQLPMVGYIRSDDLSGIVHIEDGLATSPIRIFGGQTVCTLDKQCSKLYVVTSPVAISEHLIEPLSRALLSVFADAYTIVTLDSLPREPDDDVPVVFAVGTSAESLDAIKAANAKLLPQAIFTGLSAHLLHHGAGARLACLAVEASPEHPDGRAAAALISCIDKLTPHVPIPAEPLRQEAKEMEMALANAVREAARSRAEAHATTFV